MTISEEQTEEIADEVLEVLDERITDLELDDAIEAVEAVKSAIGGREDALRDDRRRQGE